jgi:anti-sigma factor RsiW
MRCLNDETITQYIDNGFQVRKAKKIERHLSHCQTCRGREKQTRAEIDFVNRKMESLDPGHIPELVFIPPQETAPLPFMFKPAAAAAAVILVLTSVFILFLLFSTPGKNEEKQVGESTIIHSIRIGDQPVESYIIEEKETNTTLVWVEKK